MGTGVRGQDGQGGGEQVEEKNVGCQAWVMGWVVGGEGGGSGWLSQSRKKAGEARLFVAFLRGDAELLSLWTREEAQKKW